MVRRNEGERISVRIPPELLERIDALAADQGISRAAAIRQLLKDATT